MTSETAMKIGILQTGRRPDQLRDTHSDYDELFRNLLAGRGFAFDTYAVLDGVFPNRPEDAEGWLITGSKFGAYEGHDWIPPLEDLIRQIHASGRSMIGVCFGHQIIAQALGGTVEKYHDGWSIGPTNYQTHDGRRLRLNAWHQDQVTRAPKGAKCIASSDFCENAVLAYGDQILTFQAHPEFNDSFVRDLFEARRSVLPEEFAAAEIERWKTTDTTQDIGAEFERFFHRIGAPLSGLE